MPSCGRSRYSTSRWICRSYSSTEACLGRTNRIATGRLSAIGGSAQRLESRWFSRKVPSSATLPEASPPPSVVHRPTSTRTDVGSAARIRPVTIRSIGVMQRPLQSHVIGVVVPNGARSTLIMDAAMVIDQPIRCITLRMIPVPIGRPRPAGLIRQRMPARGRSHVVVVDQKGGQARRSLEPNTVLDSFAVA